MFEDQHILHSCLDPHFTGCDPCELVNEAALEDIASHSHAGFLRAKTKTKAPFQNKQGFAYNTTSAVSRQVLSEGCFVPSRIHPENGQLKMIARGVKTEYC